MAYSESLHNEYISAQPGKKKLTKREKVQQYAEANGVTINHVYKLINYGRIKL